MLFASHASLKACECPVSYGTVLQREIEPIINKASLVPMQSSLIANVFFVLCKETIGLVYSYTYTRPSLNLSVLEYAPFWEFNYLS